MIIKNVELFISVAVVLISYFISAPILGYVRATVADSMGDNTPDQLGFLTIHPLAHISKMWVFIIVLFQFWFGYMPFGLGRYIPLNATNIQGANRGAKLAMAYFSDSVVAIGLSITAFFSLILLHGPSAFTLLHHAVSLKNFYEVFPGMDSFMIISSIILITIFVMNSLTATFSLLINAFHFVFFYYFENVLKNSEYADEIMLFGPLILLYTMIYFVRGYLTMFIVGIAYALGHLVGIL